MTCGVSRWVASVGLAGGAAVTAAMIGTSIARADTIDDFLLQAEGDMAQTATLFSGLDSSSLPSPAELVSDFQTQDELISQIQAQQDTFSETLQSSSQLINADQQLANASGDLVAASQTFVNAVNAGDLPLSATETFSDKLTGLDAAFGFLNAELFQVLPAEFNAAFVTVADGGTIDFAVLDPNLGTDAAASAASLTGTESAAAMLGTVGADFSALGNSFDAAFTPFLELFSAL